MIRQIMKSVVEFLHFQADTVFYNGLFVFRNSVGLIFLYFLNNLFRWLSQKYSTVLINYRNTFGTSLINIEDISLFLEL